MRTTPGIGAAASVSIFRTTSHGDASSHHRTVEHSRRAHVVLRTASRPGSARGPLPRQRGTDPMAVAVATNGIPVQAELSPKKWWRRGCVGGCPPFLTASPAVWMASMIRAYPVQRQMAVERLPDGVPDRRSCRAQLATLRGRRCRGCRSRTGRRPRARRRRR